MGVLFCAAFYMYVWYVRMLDPLALGVCCGARFLVFAGVPPIEQVPRSDGRLLVE